MQGRQIPTALSLGQPAPGLIAQGLFASEWDLHHRHLRRLRLEFCHSAPNQFRKRFYSLELPLTSHRGGAVGAGVSAW